MSDDKKILEDGEQRNEWSLTFLVIYGCVTNYSKTLLKIPIFYTTPFYHTNILRELIFI